MISLEGKICKKSRPCPSPRIIIPRYTTLSVKNFEHAIDFHPKEKWPCKNTWYQDLRSTHIRNKHLLDLPFQLPPCCADIYNITIDKQKRDKLKKYNLYRGVRTVEYPPKPEEIRERQLPFDGNVQYFPECYEVPDSDSSDEDDEYVICSSGSVSECSGCSVFGGGSRKKLHKVVQKNWRDLLKRTDDGKCRALVKQEIKKAKRGHEGPLVLNKMF